MHLASFFKELEGLTAAGIDHKGRVLISDRAHLLFDLHMILDGASEEKRGASQIGTTRRGIGPCYSNKADRYATLFLTHLHFCRLMLVDRSSLEQSAF